MNKGTMTSPVFQNQTGDVFYEAIGLKAAFDYYSRRNIDNQEIIKSAELLYSLWAKRNMKWYYFAQGFRFGAYCLLTKVQDCDIMNARLNDSEWSEQCTSTRFSILTTKK